MFNACDNEKIIRISCLIIKTYIPQELVLVSSTVRWLFADFTCFQRTDYYVQYLTTGLLSAWRKAILWTILSEQWVLFWGPKGRLFLARLEDHWGLYSGPFWWTVWWTYCWAILVGHLLVFLLGLLVGHIWWTILVGQLRIIWWAIPVGNHSWDHL